MFQVGSLIYFTPFKFRNGSKSKPKYFLVLKKMGEKVLLATLPSSKIYLPVALLNSIGCIKDSKTDIGCFVFESKEIIGENGFYFPLKTIIYGDYIELFEEEKIIAEYPTKDIDYQEIDIVKKNVLDKVIKCFLSAPNVKFKVKKVLME